MKSKMAYVLLVIFICFGLSSCSTKDDSEPCSLAWGTELQAELNALTAAAQTYSTNPTIANCNAYKNAAQAYVNALSPYGDCAALTFQQRTSWQEVLNSAQQSVNEIDCSETM